MIAIMLEALLCQPADQALEVGAGSGYAAALLGQLVGHVDAFEIRPAIAARAAETIARLGIPNVTLHVGDGCHAAAGPGGYQRILVSAGATRVPPSLTEKLACGGRIVIPVGSAGGSQVLRIGAKLSSGIDWTRGVGCVFVPLVLDTGESLDR
jgi:protein-L-isoaspartate(D-aspartate) O-methyltransferase